MDYQTFKPSQELSTFVKCYWTLESPQEDGPTRQRIVPDGCMELIFHHGDLYRQYLNESESIIQPRCFVFGQLSRPLEIQPTGATGIFAVRFHPHGFIPFATLPLKEMTDTAVPLNVIFGQSGTDISEQILKAPSTTQRIEIVETFLMDMLNDTTTINRVISSTVETVISANGQLTIAELSRKVDVNRRQLERKFASTVGLSPKQLAKTIRLQAALKILLNKKYTSLTDLAYEGEFYDQAHFIKDFKEFTGLTPKEFYGDNLRMTSLFSGSE